MRLSDMQENQMAEVVGFNSCGRGYLRNLQAMGMTRGVNVTLKCRSPLGDSVCIEVDGTVIAVRLSEADAVINLKPSDHNIEE